MVITFSADTSGKHSINAQEIRAIGEAARIFGYRVYTIPADFDDCGTADNALAYVPHFETREVGVWNGFIPTVERYEAIYDAALRKNVQLVNSPLQHRTAMEFDRFYPLLSDLTPKSLVVENTLQLSAVPDELDFPVFVKGAVKSDKEEGWNAVVATNMDELLALAEKLFKRPYRTRGKVIVRQLVKLKSFDVSPNGFPIGREYRAFTYNGELLAYGFYWDEDKDPFGMSGEVKQEIGRLASEAARRVDVPFLAVDVGQLESGEWIVIETGDAQFTGLSHIPILELWSKVKYFTL